MQRVISTESSPAKRGRPTERLLPLRLTPREIDLLEFVLDQKFASLDALYVRFYQGVSSKSSRYAYHRLQLLKKHGFLRAKRVYTEPGSVYLASPLAHSTVQSLRPDRTISWPTEEIDLRTFEHDRRVTLCRVAREKNREVKDWLSERRLKQEWTAAAILDLFSRKVVGWALSKKIDQKLCLEALTMAVVERRPAFSPCLTYAGSPPTDGAQSTSLTTLKIGPDKARLKTVPRELIPTEHQDQTPSIQRAEFLPYRLLQKFESKPRTCFLVGKPQEFFLED